MKIYDFTPLHGCNGQRDRREKLFTSEVSVINLSSTGSRVPITIRAYRAFHSSTVSFCLWMNVDERYASGSCKGSDYSRETLMRNMLASAGVWTEGRFMESFMYDTQYMEHVAKLLMEYFEINGYIHKAQG